VTTGVRSDGSVRRIAASLLVVGFGLAADCVSAEQVGVAAAVNPDAFSSLAGAPQSQLRIGKSIFYSERINTTGSGLVQVLLVDGSTFTVGPGSDLVIDRFVYDPKKGTGQIAASFSKGVMRFVGGKISKNDNAVSINTPAGTLAVRGCIVLGTITNSANFGFVLVYGDYMKMNKLVVFEPGNGFFSQSGKTVIAPAGKGVINQMMAGLTNSKSDGTNNTTNPSNTASTGLQQLALSKTADEVINEATSTQIQDTVKDQLIAAASEPTDPGPTDPGPTDPGPTDPGPTDPGPTDPGPTDPGPTDPVPPTPRTEGTFNGYVGGLEQRPGGNRPPSAAPFAIQAASNGGFVLNVDKSAGTVSAAFTAALAANDLSIKFQEGKVEGQWPTLTESLVTYAGKAPNVGTATLNVSNELLCQRCDFMQFGSWASHLVYPAAQGPVGSVVNLFLSGYWVAGDVTQSNDIPFTGSASYAGEAIGSVANNLNGLGWQTYKATGDLSMTWNFASSTGDFAISHFDTAATSDGLSFGGPMCAPGVAGCGTPSGNHFGGPLSGGLPNGAALTGFAAGSFVNNGSDKAAGVIGNWNISNSQYEATGIFGGLRR
jgi:hypothetical protein